MSIGGHTARPRSFMLDPAVLHALERGGVNAQTATGLRMAGHGVLDITLACERGRKCAQRGQNVEGLLLAVRGGTRARPCSVRPWSGSGCCSTIGSPSAVPGPDPAGCADLCREALETGSVAPLVVAAERLRDYLSQEEGSSGWTHTELLSLIRRPDARRERSIHGLC